MRVIVAEKPSVARDLARVLGASEKHEGWIGGDDVVITWCIGHLLELEDPAHYEPAWKAWRMDTLPMVPAAFAVRARKGSAAQLKVVKGLLRDRRAREVVDACDAGREGELIFRLVYDFAGCRLPVQRLWVSSLTDEAIRQGFRQLQPASRYDALGDAARCRSEADWLVGLNATRAMTCLTRQQGGDELWSIGRVQTPTLAMIVRRDREITAFVPQDYWQVKATLSVDRPEGPMTWTGTWFREGAEPDPKGEAKGEAAEGEEAPHAERLPTEAAARALADAVIGQPGVVQRATRSERRERPPLLYDLTALQRRANQRYGLSAQQTLDVAQALYESHKLITYPRTDARHLTSDQVPELPGVVRGVGALQVYRPFVEAILARPLPITSRLVDNAEVGDHHAILPTGRSFEPGRLSGDEKRVYDLVARRLLAALSPDAIFDQAEIVVAVTPRGALPEGLPTPPRFRARGRVLRQAGWRAVDPPAASRDLLLPLVQQGEATTTPDAKVVAGQTRPPRPHDDASLLQAMETAGKELDDAELKRVMRHAGLGTPATRAAILQTLVERKYVSREGKALRATPRGMALIDALPVEELKSAELTGRWEKRLSDVAEGRDRRDAFMRDVVQHTHVVVEAIRGATTSAVMSRAAEGKPIGTCPLCGGKVVPRRGGWRCAGCTLSLWDTVARKKLTQALVKELLKERRTRVIDGLKNKAGREFSAGLVLGDDGKVVFWFPPREGEASPSPAAPAPSAPASSAAVPEGLPCPVCGLGRVMRGRAAWGCDRYQHGCGWRLSFVDEQGQARSPEAAVAAVRSAARPGEQRAGRGDDQRR